MRLTTDTIKSYLCLGVASLFLAYVVSAPINYDQAAVGKFMESLSQTWWKLALLASMLLSVAIWLYGRYPSIAEFIGMVGFSCAFSPFVGLITGIPEEIGWPVLLFFWGGFMVIGSISALAAHIVLELATRTEDSKSFTRD
jgi:hypothetical protein